MHEHDNPGIIEHLFGAYQSGDIQTVLEGLTEDVVWDFPGPPNVPFAGRRFGREQAAEFFKKLGEAIEVRHFQPREFVSDGDTVVAIGSSTYVLRETGREISLDWVMVFSMRDGKVAEFREFIDTAVLSNAFDTGQSMLEGISGTF